MQFQKAYSKIAELLLNQRDSESGAWTGRLSSSALSTALAVTALAGGGEDDCAVSRMGAQWLVDNMNSDGGWGDTPGSPSNISTSLIARACLSRFKGPSDVDATLTESAVYIMAEDRRAFS